ncbi:MAG: hypothetical protein IJ745_06190 [Bacteroidales bacterium]|nr:hypothetical protein [Bacteroidales bacterium]
MKGLEQYDVKLLLALVKSVSGRIDFFKLLVQMKPELAAFSNAIRGDDDAMVWLFKHDFAWLAILSNACDGDEKAIDWVRRGLTPVNLRFVLACRHDVDSLKWLYRRRLDVLLMLVREVERFLKYQQKEFDWPYVMHFGGHYRAMMELEEWKNGSAAPEGIKSENPNENVNDHDKERQQQTAEKQ